MRDFMSEVLPQWRTLERLVPEWKRDVPEISWMHQLYRELHEVLHRTATEFVNRKLEELRPGGRSLYYASVKPDDSGEAICIGLPLSVQVMAIDGWDARRQVFGAGLYQFRRAPEIDQIICQVKGQEDEE